MDLSLDDLVCLHLLEQTPSGDDRGDLVERTPTGIAAGIGIASDDVRGRLDVFESATSLVERGLLGVTVRATEDGVERSVYSLTDEGRARAEDRRRRLFETVDGESIVNADRPLWAVADAEPDSPLGSVLAKLATKSIGPSESHAPGAQFVDRARELSELVEALESIDARGGRTVLVTGDAGVGKSALLDRLVDHASDSGMVIGRAACQRGSDEPYGPLRRAIESAFDAAVLDPLADASAAGIDEDVPLSARRSALLGDVSTAVCDRSTSQPTVLFVDDLQWADRSTLSLFERLADECAAWVYPILLIGAFRPIDDGSALATVRSRLVSSTRVSELHVAPFDWETTAAFVRRLVDDPDVPSAFVDLVQESTAGNPLIVEEAVTGMLAADEIDPGRGLYPRTTEGLDLPGGPERAVERRVESLDETGVEIVEIASVVGRTVPYDVLASAVSLPESILRDYLALLVDARLFDWTGEPGTGSVQFASGLVRETILSGLDDDRRQTVHELAAESLIETNAPPSTIADQCAAAGQLSRAISHYERAAERARATYAGEAAIESYERAIELAERLGESDRATALRLELGTVRFVRGEAELACRDFELACERALDPAVAARAHHRLAEIRIKQGTVADGLDVVEAGLRLVAERVPAADRCRLYRVRGWGLLQTGDLDGARTAFEEQLAVAEAARDPLLCGLATHDLGTLDGKTGLFERAETRLANAAATFERLEEANYGAKSLTNLSLVYRHGGDLESAICANERALSLQREHGFKETMPDSLINQALLYRAQGNLSRSVEEYEAAIEAGRQIGREERIAKARVNVAQVHAKRGRLDLADARCREAIATFDELDGVDGKTLAYATSARINELAGRGDRARADAERSLSIARELGNDDRIAAAHDALGRVYRSAGEPETARTHHETARELAADGANDVDVTRYTLELVCDVRDAGAIDEAHELAADAATAAANTDERLLDARARSIFGVTCVDVGALERAEQELSTAFEIQRTCGATVDRCETMLAQCRLDLARDDPDAARERLAVVTALVSEYGLNGFEPDVRRLRERIDAG
ncbi:ATP-binding protein [Halovivax gelatinilyticus]|uniref:ATP-binding protein n=1 Tax=Halovivax gelatinilyticus TaxID=2961597 RepID=UPI0020CA34BC|nr:tetratricopeptide repeat protein [Halovivax gelatinilyticus]